METIFKTKMMENNRAGILQHQVESWKRLVDFIQGENSALKNQIALIANGDVTSVSLAQVENFLQRLLQKEELITLIKKDVRELEKLLQKKTDKAEFAEIRKKSTKLRYEIEKLEQKFNELKFEFHDFANELA